jgi:hypothetical protein
VPPEWSGNGVVGAGCASPGATVLVQPGHRNALYPPLTMVKAS